MRVLPALLVGLLHLAATSVTAQEACDPWDIVRTAVRDGHSMITLLHTKRTIPHGTSFEPGDIIGEVQPRPERLSEHFHQDILRSERLYQQHRFAAAAQVLEEAYRAEPDNPFVANAYARALYWIDARREESYRVYRDLVAQLDSTARARLGSDAAYIDMWFFEAYWKLGTLHMDHEAYGLAIFEISRGLGSRYGMGMDRFYEQAFLYLAKAFSGIGDKKTSACLAKAVLQLNPDNRHARSYLEEGPK